MFFREKTVLVIIDVQEKLTAVMPNKASLVENIRKLIKGMRLLGVPLLWVEQNPDGLGPTVREIASELTDTEPIRKISFSCCANKPFARTLKEQNRQQVLLAGIEAHVCVYQTARDLLGRGYEVQAVSDAVASRTESNRRVGLRQIREQGGRVTSTETVLFELLRVGDGDEYRQIREALQ